MLDVVINGKALAEVQSPPQTEETLNPNRNRHGNASGQQAEETLKGTVFTDYYSDSGIPVLCLIEGSCWKEGQAHVTSGFHVVQELLHLEPKTCLSGIHSSDC